MEVRHNTTLLEQAVEHVVRRAAIPVIKAEADALYRKSRAASTRRLATGGAIAIAAVGIGLGAYLGFWTPSKILVTAETGKLERPLPKVEPEIASSEGVKTKEERKTEPAPPPSKSDSRLEPSVEEVARPDEPEIITTNYNIFKSKTVTSLGQSWNIEAGHFFKNETDPVWQWAWCYTRKDVNGISLHVDLARRDSPTALPAGPIASQETLESAGLTDAAALVLATECPWADAKKYAVRDFQPPGGSSNPWSQKPPEVSLNGSTLVYAGDIGLDFLDILRRHRFDELQIDSMGGLIEMAMSAGSWLREGGKTVRVKGSCLSACVLVLAGGKARSAEEVARIGVHRFYSTEATDPKAATETAQQTSSEIISYLQRMGIGVELFHAMAAVPSESMEFIDHDKLRKWKLIGGDAIVVEPVPPAESPDQGTSTDAKKTFASLDGFDAVGHDLVGMPLRGVSLVDCQKSCSQDQKCRALTYNKKALACFLKENATLMLEDKGAFTAYDKQLEQRLRFSKLALSPGMVLPGKAYTEKTGPRYIDCILLCENDAKCKGFNFDLGHKVCTLMDYVGGDQKPNPQFASGEKGGAIRRR